MTLQQAKKELNMAYIAGEGYDQDETFYVCYDDGTVEDTQSAEKKLSTKDIIGIMFCGSCERYAVGQELYKGEYRDLTLEDFD